MRTLKAKIRVGAVCVVAIVGIAFAALTSGPAGAAGRPKPPDLSHPTKLVLLGRNGQPIIGKSGKPIMLTIGGPPPVPPAPGSAAFTKLFGAQKPLTPDEVQQALNSGPVVISIPNYTDQEKARALAPSQAAP